MEEMENIKELISAALDEKRNLISFALTIVTTLLAPLAILTGYWGMNFDNMEELSAVTYEASGVPGITLMWIVSGTAYGFLLALLLHFRIFYSAT